MTAMLCASVGRMLVGGVGVRSGRIWTRMARRTIDAAIAVGNGGHGVGLVDDPFSWQLAKDGRVLIFRDGRQVAVVAGAQADRLRPKLAKAPDEA